MTGQQVDFDKALQIALILHKYDYDGALANVKDAIFQVFQFYISAIIIFSQLPFLLSTLYFNST